MPRAPRSFHGPGFFHITTRGDRREEVFFDERDYARFVEILDDVVRRYRWRCFAYCLMPNHYHLLIEVRDESLSDGMRLLNGKYAQWFNRRHGFVGHVFQERYYAGNVETDYHLLETTRYIVVNPVRAGLCRAAGDWRWSSYRACVGKTPRPEFLVVDWLLVQFRPNLKLARAAYETFVREAPLRVRPRGP